MNKKSAKHEKVKVKKEKSNKSGFFAKLKAGFLKMSVTKRAVIISLSCICLALLIAIGTVLSVYFNFKKEYNDRYTEITDPDILQIKPINEKIVNIALFGIDSRSEN